MHTRQYSALIKRIDTFQWCIIQAPNPCSFPVPADTSFLMESSKKVGKKQKWRLLKFKISRYFHSYRTKHQNPLPSLPLLKHLKKNPHLPAQLIQFLSENGTLWRKRTRFPPNPCLSFGCFMREEICLLPTCLYQVLASPEKDSTTLGTSPSNPKAFYLISIYTVLTAYSTHP